MVFKRGGRGEAMSGRVVSGYGIVDFVVCLLTTLGILYLSDIRSRQDGGFSRVEDQRGSLPPGAEGDKKINMG